MANSPRFPEPKNDPGRGPDRGAATGTRRWPFVLGIILVIALLGLMVFLHLTGTFGPGAH